MPVARRVLPWLLIAALVAAQLLGMMHRVVHAPLVPHAAGLAHDMAHEAHFGRGAVATPHAHDAQAAHGAHEAHGGLAALFSGHDESDCPLYDALGLDAAPLPLLALSLPAPVFVRLHFLLGEFLARRAALFEARGPPSAVS